MGFAAQLGVKSAFVPMGPKMLTAANAKPRPNLMGNSPSAMPKPPVRPPQLPTGAAAQAIPSQQPAATQPRTWSGWASDMVTGKPFRPSMQSTAWRNQPQGSALSPLKAVGGLLNTASLGMGGLVGPGAGFVGRQAAGLFPGTLGGQAAVTGTGVALGDQDSYFYNPERFKHEHSQDVTGKGPVGPGAYSFLNLMSNPIKSVANGVPLIFNELREGHAARQRANPNRPWWDL